MKIKKETIKENKNGFLIETSVRSTINYKGGADNGR